MGDASKITCKITGFKWVKELSKVNERFIKNYDENSNIGYILELDVEYPKMLLSLHKDQPFYLKEKKQKSRKTYLRHRRQRKISCSHKKPKTTIKSWINTKMSMQSNSI